MPSQIEPIEGPEHIPHPLAIITVGDPEDPKRRNGMTAAWISRVSWNPPLVMVSIAPSRHTLQLIKEFGEFAVNIVSERLADAASNIFGYLSGRDTDKFARAGIEPERARAVRAPVIREAPVVLECRVRQYVAAGDHVLVLGEVVAAYRNSDEKPVTWLNGQVRRLL